MKEQRNKDLRHKTNHNIADGNSTSINFPWSPHTGSKDSQNERRNTRFSLNGWRG